MCWNTAKLREKWVGVAEEVWSKRGVTEGAWSRETPVDEVVEVAYKRKKIVTNSALDCRPGEKTMLFLSYSTHCDLTGCTTTGCTTTGAC